MNHNQSAKNHTGFTLLELLVAMGIFAMISLVAAGFLIDTFRYKRTLWEQLETQNDGRRVLQQVVDTVRKAEESSIGGYPVVSVGDYELIIYANVDTDSLRERVRFWLDGATLKKGIIQATGNPLNYSGTEDVVELAHNVVNFSESKPLFLYYDDTYTGTEAALSMPVDVTAVKVVRVQLKLDSDPAQEPAPLAVESVAAIRNLKEN